MWTNEVIFSEGDLMSQQEEYERFIETEYAGSYADRLSHIGHMIKRLQAEKELLEVQNNE